MSHIQGLPPLPKCFDGLISTHRTISESSQGEVHEGEAHVLVRNSDLEEVSEVNEEALDHHELAFEEAMGDSVASAVMPDNNAPFSKLNQAYEKLKSEMVRTYNILCMPFTVQVLRRLYRSRSTIKNFAR